MEPGFRHVPFAFDGSRGTAERFGGLLDAQAREEAQLNDAALLWSDRSQLMQRIIERKQIEILFF